MFFNYSVSTPKATASVPGLITELKICRGVIHQLDFVFPPGPQGLLHVALYDSLHQCWPTNPGEMFAGDNSTISFREHFPVLYEPFILDLHTYNDDDTWPHTVVVRIGILPVEILAPWLLGYDERLRAALGY